MDINFNYRSNISSLLGLVLSILVLLGCTQEDMVGQPTNNAQEEILEIYSSKYLSDDNHKLYYKSEKKKHISELFDFPLSKDDLKLPDIAVLPGTDIQPADTLFTKKELESWDVQLSTYKQINWSLTTFPDYVSFINKNEIPEYQKRHSAAPPGEEPLYIHYITPPLLYEDKSALMYSRNTKGAGSTRINYLYFKKVNNEWNLVKKVRFRTMY
jgi:hypothetical protein